MGGGLMQLVAYGAQDVYLTGNPQITFFKVVYRRHTNFSMESIRQTPNGQVPRQTVTIARNGDLVYKMCIEVSGTTPQELNPLSGVTGGSSSDEKVSQGPSNILKNVEVEIGGQLIDKFDGKFIQIHSDLFEHNPTGSELSLYQSSVLKGQTSTYCGGTSWIPLPFWFCRNPGLALPLIALQYHEVKLNIEYVDKIKDSSNKLRNSSFDVWVDYIYLDTDERRRFAQVSHEYLIEQVQMQEETVSLKKFNLVFNHPVKELIWVYQTSDAFSEKGELEPPFNNCVFNVDATNGQLTPNDPNDKCMTTLKLNGQDRFTQQPPEYFTRLQPWKYHSGSSLNKYNKEQQNDGVVTGYVRNKWVLNNQLDSDYINVYSFALKPEEHQPSGTCNFSRIDSAVLVNNTDSWANVSSTDTLTIYAINYNVLRIMSGMGGLAYSN